MILGFKKNLPLVLVISIFLVSGCASNKANIEKDEAPLGLIQITFNHDLLAQKVILIDDVLGGSLVGGVAAFDDGSAIYSFAIRIVEVAVNYSKLEIEIDDLGEASQSKKFILTVPSGNAVSKRITSNVIVTAVRQGREMGAGKNGIKIGLPCRNDVIRSKWEPKLAANNQRRPSS